MTYFNDLLDGYQRFRTADYRRQHERWAQLKDGQAPKVMVIGCADSRVEPSQIFDTLPGEIFVVRNVANLVPPYETTPGHHGVSAALEFAVTKLGVEEIVVIGHGKCGGAHAALTEMFHDAERGDGGFVHDWVSLLDGAREKVKAKFGDSPDLGREMELETVRTSLANLMTFPFVKSRVEAGTLKLHGAYFAITDGELWTMGEDGEFVSQLKSAPALA
ncbi:carbonic anhydrase [Sphingomonas sp. BGYR3]|uniref:carbonic anhydrase n=1 Tax=Sphingomonas sp. BGYR3 TaxID=2975483 RepID=UPI0021A7A4F0|nr:carbonic anhydrase [Sphingomonas sp. BGYR3]MDG5489708.1 carbonic anhydrase [Sphingomonas sp. BGYR3]